MRNLAALQFVKGEAGAPGYYPAAPHTLGEPPANHPARGPSFLGVQPGTFIPSKRWAPCRSHFTPKLIVFPSSDINKNVYSLLCDSPSDI